MIRLILLLVSQTTAVCPGTQLGLGTYQVRRTIEAPEFIRPLAVDELHARELLGVSDTVLEAAQWGFASIGFPMASGVIEVFKVATGRGGTSFSGLKDEVITLSRDIAANSALIRTNAENIALVAELSANNTELIAQLANLTQVTRTELFQRMSDLASTVDNEFTIIGDELASILAAIHTLEERVIANRQHTNRKARIVRSIEQVDDLREEDSEKLMKLASLHEFTGGDASALLSEPESEFFFVKHVTMRPLFFEVGVDPILFTEGPGSTEDTCLPIFAIGRGTLKRVWTPRGLRVPDAVHGYFIQETITDIIYRTIPTSGEPGESAGNWNSPYGPGLCGCALDGTCSPLADTAPERESLRNVIGNEFISVALNTMFRGANTQNTSPRALYITSKDLQRTSEVGSTCEESACWRKGGYSCSPPDEPEYDRVCAEIFHGTTVANCEVACPGLKANEVCKIENYAAGFPGASTVSSSGVCQEGLSCVLADTTECLTTSPCDVVYRCGNSASSLINDFLSEEFGIMGDGPSLMEFGGDRSRRDETFDPKPFGVVRNEHSFLLPAISYPVAGPIVTYGTLYTDPGGLYDHLYDAASRPVLPEPIEQLWRLAGFRDNIGLADYGPLRTFTIGRDVLTGEERVLDQNYTMYSDAIIAFSDGMQHGGYEEKDGCTAVPEGGLYAMCCDRVFDHLEGTLADVPVTVMKADFIDVNTVPGLFETLALINLTVAFNVTPNDTLTEMFSKIAATTSDVSALVGDENDVIRGAGAVIESVTQSQRRLDSLYNGDETLSFLKTSSYLLGLLAFAGLAVVVWCVRRPGSGAFVPMK